MIYNHYISSLKCEAGWWHHGYAAQIRLRLPGSPQLSRWLGQCIQNLNQDGVAQEVLAGVNSLTFTFLPQSKIQPIMEMMNQLPVPAESTVSVYTLPVMYRPNDADTAVVCAKLGIDFEALVDLHSNCEYYVACIGFMPGFIYLGGGQQRLQLPRKHTPASRVAPGSVAIADAYTGLYSVESPGGWHIIGTSQCRGYDSLSQSFLPWKVGDKIFIKAITP
ncbi:MAG: carboxyltransferase domain-containing protein [Saprospiraceae bacterium]|jgi:KipI family sensor histidine kinase inhibitor